MTFANTLGSSSAQLFAPAKRNSALDDNMVPMINIVFLLIIFFMIAGQIKTIETADISLPTSSQPDSATPAKLTIRLNAHRQLFLNDADVEKQALAAALTEYSASTDLKDLSINLVFDQSLNASDVEAVLLPLRSLGVEKISLLTEAKAAI